MTNMLCKLFESEAVDYLLKPVERHRLGQTKERLERNQSKTTLPDEIQKLTALLAQWQNTA